MTRHTLDSWLRTRKEEDLQSVSVGFVPTMGALHAGHCALLERSARENERTLLSIFVNPTQFNDPADLEKYPRTVERDCELAEEAGCTDVILPTMEDIYPHGYRYSISEQRESTILCGAHRPGHFTGVLTVVMKLLHISGAQCAYFGEKDYQQYRLIEQMCRDFFMEIEIIPCPIVRDIDGLALSSRNIRLTPSDRIRAAEFPRILRHAQTPQIAVEQLQSAGMTVEYVEEHWGRRLGAVHCGGVRLIDNIALSDIVIQG